MTALEEDKARLESSILPLPIPPHGELTVYYDMYALSDARRPEVGGYARLGDPTDLVGGAGGRIVPTTSASQVPEPATMLLIGAGLVAIRVIGRKLWRPENRSSSC
jgi:hypothetical protein